MDGQELVNLIDILKVKNMSSEEIIDVIKYVESTTPENNFTSNNTEQENHTLS